MRLYYFNARVDKIEIFDKKGSAQRAKDGRARAGLDRDQQRSTAATHTYTKHINYL